MPIYEYLCGSCEQKLEKLQKISDQPLTLCPSCGKSELKKMVSASSFRLKGTGWYETDFKNNNKKKPDAEKANNEDSVKTDAGKADKATPEKSGNESKDTAKKSDSE